MKIYEARVGDWVRRESGGVAELVVDIRLDGYVQLAPALLFWHASGLENVSIEEVCIAKRKSFEGLIRAYRKQLFVELCRIKKWKEKYKKETSIPAKKVEDFIESGFLPLHAALNWDAK